jgi:hypothetical protein
VLQKLNIYDYMSPDIAAHCQKIGHAFSPLEMAVIIEYSEKSIKEKLAAWRVIIDEYPDMPIQASVEFHPRESLHEYLLEYVYWHEKWIAQFYSGGGKAIFRAHPYLINQWGESDYDIGCYSTLPKALKAVINYASGYESTSISKIRIAKEKIDAEFGTGDSALFDPEGELLEIYDWYEEESELEDVFIHLPIPFEKGDIVTGDDGEPCVIVALPHWDKSYEEYLSGKREGDGRNLSGLAIGFMKTNDGGSKLEHSHPCTYRLQYYKKELQGQESFLKAFSQYIKLNGENNDGNAVLLIDAFLKYKAEGEAEKMKDADWLGK